MSEIAKIIVKEVYKIGRMVQLSTRKNETLEGRGLSIDFLASLEKRHEEVSMTTMLYELSFFCVYMLQLSWEQKLFRSLQSCVSQQRKGKRVNEDKSSFSFYPHGS